MKNKLFLLSTVLAFCSAIHLNTSIASENQSWSDWARTKWAELTASKANVQKLKTLAVVPVAYSTQKLGPVLTIGTGKMLGLKAFNQATESLWGYSFNNAATMYIWLAATIGAIIIYNKAGQRNEKITAIKNALKMVVADQLLYPTRSSKIHALLKKDEFLQYIEDQDGLVQEACNELIKEINALPYADEQKKSDALIDAKMTEVRNMINQYATLEKQIAVLESQQYTATVPNDMRAYLSVYFRLKNKQATENKLPVEEKISRQIEREELVKSKKPTLTSPVLG